MIKSRFLSMNLPVDIVIKIDNTINEDNVNQESNSSRKSVKDNNILPDFRGVNSSQI